MLEFFQRQDFETTTHNRRCNFQISIQSCFTLNQIGIISCFQIWFQNCSSLLRNDEQNHCFKLTRVSYPSSYWNYSNVTELELIQSWFLESRLMFEVWILCWCCCFWLFKPLVLGFDGVVWGFLMDNKSTGHTHWFGSNQEIHSRFDCSDQLVIVYFFLLSCGRGCCIYLWGRRSFEKRRWWTAITNGLGPAAVTVAASLHAPIEDATPTAFGIHWPLSPRNDSRRQYPLFYAFDIILRWWNRGYWSCVGRDRCHETPIQSSPVGSSHRCFMAAFNWSSPVAVAESCGQPSSPTLHRDVFIPFDAPPKHQRRHYSNHRHSKTRHRETISAFINYPQRKRTRFYRNTSKLPHASLKTQTQPPTLLNQTVERLLKVARRPSLEIRRHATGQKGRWTR